MTRRQLMIAAGGAGVASLIAPQEPGSGDDSKSGIAANVAIARLKAGNQRFVEGKSKHFRENRVWRESLIAGQNPFAIILGCADSRVPTELVFDQGFGNLFVIRNAGNVVMDDVLGSIEYASFHLHTKLVVVMGHEGCGAVTAALKSREERASEPPELQTILDLIDPAVAHLDLKSKDVVEQGVEANVRWSIKKMIRLQEQRKREDDFKVVGAVYELKSGRVRFLDEKTEKEHREK